MSSPTNKELAQLLISGTRKTIKADNAKHATAIRVAGHRLNKVLTVHKDGKSYSLTLSDSKITHRTAEPAKAKRTARVAATKSGGKKRKSASVLD